MGNEHCADTSRKTIKEVKDNLIALMKISNAEISADMQKKCQRTRLPDRLPK